MKKVNFKLVTTRSLGTRVVVWDGDQPRLTNVPFILRGATLPAAHSCGLYKASTDKQEYFDVPVVEFEDDDNFDAVGIFRFQCVPNTKRGDRFMLTFQYDIKGIPSVITHDLNSGWQLAFEMMDYVEPNLGGIKHSPVRVSPRRIVFAVSASSSMAGEKMIHTKQTLMSNARHLLAVGGEGCQVGVVSFSDSAHIVCSPTSRIEELERAVKAITPAGTMVAMDEGLRQAAGLIAAAPRETGRGVMLIADRMPKGRRRQSTLDEVRDARSKGINIYPVGIGCDRLDLEFLWEIWPHFLAIEKADEDHLKQITLLTLAIDEEVSEPSALQETKMVLRYRLVSGQGRRQAGGMRLTWNVENPFPNFAGFVLVASQMSVPEKPDDGVELFRWISTREQLAGNHTALISLAPIKQRRWTRFYCKAMVVSAAQQQAVLVIHPNTCAAISDTGRVEASKSDSTPRHYHLGRQKKVTCPHCFHEFPLWQMLFAPAGEKGPQVLTQYTWIDRLIRRPPRLPVNKWGELLTRKFSPRCHHELPFTAGEQETLLIGLVGANFSGTSTYLASLVHSLRERIVTDFKGYFAPACEETNDRYQQNYEQPLFRHHYELSKTAGTPPPLIYNLILNGRLWGEKRNREVTLVLYETAGENFHTSDRVRRMVEYLRAASGIIFLVDPLEACAVRRLLPATMRLSPEGMTPPQEIISRVIVELENTRTITEAAPLPMPVAVTLTKCDVLREGGLIDTNRLWSTGARHSGFFDTETHEDMTGMMGECVQKWSPDVYNTVRQRFAHHAFFGVSATGCASDNSRYKFISPWRVEDPLLWLLAELGVIPKR